MAQFTSLQKVATEATLTEDGFILQVLTKDGAASEIYSHGWGDNPEFDKALAMRGAADILKTAYNGIRDSDRVIAKTNNAITALREGNFVSRSKNESKEKALSYLVQAVILKFPEVTAEAWYSMDKEARKGYTTAEVLKVASALEVLAKKEEAEDLLAGL